MNPDSKSSLSNARQEDQDQRKRSFSSSIMERQKLKHRRIETNVSHESPLTHPFKANFNDHFETSVEAIRDIFCVVNEVRQLVRPSVPECYSLYDPYYCSGGIVKVWEKFGIKKIIHENRDFYADMKENSIPAFDMLVTNPPFSDNHMERLLQYLLSQGKPWAFLAPEYVTTKDWYKTMIHEKCSAFPPIKGDIQSTKTHRLKPEPFSPPPFLFTGIARPTVVDVKPLEPFYLVPSVRYDFYHPLGAGHEHSHFKTIWYVQCGVHTEEVIRGATVALSKETATRGTPTSSIVRGLQNFQHVQRCISSRGKARKGRIKKIA